MSLWSYTILVELFFIKTWGQCCLDNALRHMVQFLGLSTAGPGAGIDDPGCLPTQHILWCYFQSANSTSKQKLSFFPHSEAQRLKTQPKGILIVEILRDDISSYTKETKYHLQSLVFSMQHTYVLFITIWNTREERVLDFLGARRMPYWGSKYDDGLVKDPPFFVGSR